MAPDRYVGLSAWYDEVAVRSAQSSRAELVDLLGPGEGRCLDLGCGTGLYLEAIAATGRTPIGVDMSADQLGIARARCSRIVQADAMRLPFADGVFETVAGVWVSSDFDDLAAAAYEAARVLFPGGPLVLYGVHPCFNGPFVETLEDGSRLVHPGYRRAARYDTAPWWGEGGIRSRVGMWHRPLADVFNVVIGAGLRIDRVVEPREEPVPFILALVASKDPRRDG